MSFGFHSTKSSTIETLPHTFRIFASPLRWGKDGLVAEWLGSALQKLLQRFESAPDLQKKSPVHAGLSLFHGILCHSQT